MRVILRISLLIMRPSVLAASFVAQKARGGPTLLKRESVVAGSAITAANGKSYRGEHINLDVIISVG